MTMSALSDIQDALVAAWSADGPLTVLVPADAIFDAPPKGRQPPYVTILAHDAAPRDGDETPGLEHRMTVHCWTGQPSRKAALAIADRVMAVATGGTLAPQNTVLTLRRHVRTETVIDLATGRARAAVLLRFHSEPAE